MSNTLYTIGHSTRKVEELIAALQHYSIEVLVDIRHFPRSRHNPQFNKEDLEKVLLENRIAYEWNENLGGYEAHMESAEFKAGLEHLMEIARTKRTAIMCAEILWFKCHRRMVADLLTGYGWRVLHIYNEKRADEHKKREGKVACQKMLEKKIRKALANSSSEKK